MATIVSIEPVYSPYSGQMIEICPHCERPLCPHCWNHANLTVKTVNFWECSNSICKLHFHYKLSEGD